MTANAKLVQYLNEAHATETTLVTTLTAHAAITPEGPYRDLLERHVQETRDQATALQQRLGEIGAARSPIAQTIGFMEAIAGQALALSRAPLDMLRGSSGEEKLLKNAKDEISSEALEIATYDALEALATTVGDEVTAQLARDHRAQEEAMLGDLRGLIPSLTAAMASAAEGDEGGYDVAKTGAADAVREAVESGGEQARAARRAAARTAAKSVRAAAEELEHAAEEVRGRARRASGRTSGDADAPAGRTRRRTGSPAADTAEATAESAPPPADAQPVAPDTGSPAADTAAAVAAGAPGAGEAGATGPDTGSPAADTAAAVAESVEPAPEGGVEAPDTGSPAADTAAAAAGAGEEQVEEGDGSRDG